MRMKILIVTAHPDDLEFSIGATITQFVKNNEIYVFTLSNAKTYNKNFDLYEEMKQSMNILGIKRFHVDGFETNRFKEHNGEIKDYIFQVKEDFQPDLVFCTSPSALHDDHQVVGTACESIFTDISVYAMEDVRGNQRQVINCWNPVTSQELQLKWKALQCYQSQNHRHYHDFKIIESIARQRGMQINTEFAEGFEVIRKVGNLG